MKLKDYLDLFWDFKFPTLIAFAAVAAVHFSWIVPNGVQTANPLNMGKMYFIVFVVVLIPCIVIEELIRRSRR